MNYKNLTSIILPAWMPKNSDKEKYVSWALQSLNETTDMPFELLVIDNETSAESKKFLKKTLLQFKNNKYCRQASIFYSKKNIGFTGAWDLGIKESQGKYVCVINDDLVFGPNWLSRMLKHIRGDVIAVGPTTNYASGLQLVTNSKKDIYEERVNFLIGFCLLIKKGALNKIYDRKRKFYIDPIFYPGGSEELDICIKLKKIGYDLVIAHDVFIHHFGSKSLPYYKEYNPQTPMEFYHKRLQLLEQKHPGWVKHILDYQHCPTFAIGIPTLGEINYMFLTNYPWVLQRAWKTFGFDNVIPMLGPRNMVHLGRAEIVHKALIFGAKYLFFLDDDALIPIDTIERLYNHQKDYITAVMYKRRSPFNPTIFKGRNKDGSFIPFTLRNVGLVEIDVSGLACTLIKMSVIKKLLKGRQKEIEKRGGLFYFSKYGEDFNFCQDLKEKLGIKLYADTNILTEHIGESNVVNWQTFEQYRNLSEQK